MKAVIPPTPGLDQEKNTHSRGGGGGQCIILTLNGRALQFQTPPQTLTHTHTLYSTNNRRLLLKVVDDMLPVHLVRHMTLARAMLAMPNRTSLEQINMPNYSSDPPTMMLPPARLRPHESCG